MTVVGVRFKHVGKIYYFDPGNMEIEKNAAVIVETARGVEYGHAVLAKREIPDDESLLPLKKVIRVATADDKKQEDANREREKDAFVICIEKIKNHGLDMHLVDVELTFDMNKIIFYFTADGRVDFRELVKDLAYVFRMRIELRQIGVRDEAKILNGVGICGRTLCCATFLDEFQPVSIKMAKDQNFNLNPSKISGICGRLMCCLKYEEETYEFLNKTVPGVGDLVRTPDGDGDVVSVNVLRQTARVSVQKKKGEDAVIQAYDAKDITVLEHRPQPEQPEDERERRPRYGSYPREPQREPQREREREQQQ